MQSIYLVKESTNIYQQHKQTSRVKIENYRQYENCLQNYHLYFLHDVLLIILLK